MSGVAASDQRSGDAHWAGPRRRRVGGAILLVVLVVVAMVSLLAVSFFYQMNAEHEATRVRGYRVQARAAAMAGNERVSLVLREYRLDPTKWFDNEAIFKRQLIFDRLDPKGHKTSELGEMDIGEDEEEKQSEAWRYSIVRDAPDDDQYPTYGIIDESAKLNINVAPRGMLLRLPGMSASLVDALIDWRDGDDTPEPQGAEDEYYQLRKPPYNAKNAPFDSVEELLMVKGFTSGVLFGEDMNRNGLLDRNEDDGERSLPPDNGDGKLYSGIAPLVTVWSRDFNVSSDNKPRININGGAGQIRSLMSKEFRAEVVAFVVHARQTLGSSGPAFQSPADLLGMEAEGRKSPVTLAEMPLIMDRLTTTQLPGQFGLINATTAPRAVLLTIPGLAPQHVDAIVGKRGGLAGEKLATTAWLVTEGVLDATTFQAVSSYLTSRSMQFSVESLGYRDGLGIQARIQAVVEMRGPQAQILYYRDLTSLGSAYDVVDDRTGEEHSGGEPVG